MLAEIRVIRPKAELRFWCDRPFYPEAKKIITAFDPSLRVDRITAGKFRRYNHISAWRQALLVSIVLRNIGDMFLVVFGIIQSLTKLILWRPDVVFTKGGYVCLPVGIAAHLLRIPLVIHDSDAHPGLTNRILARYATKIATGAPLEYYSYPKEKTTYVGVPTGSFYKPFSSKEKSAAKKEWGLSEDRPLIVITGGGLGATRINDAVKASLDRLMKLGSVVLISGTAQYDALRRSLPENNQNFQLHAFVSGIVSLFGAADVVVARAGATTILELAALKKPTILVPNAKLTGGHQVKNAAVYSAADAVLVLDENKFSTNDKILPNAVKKLLEDPKGANEMAERFGEFAKPDAAKDVANMILKAAKRK